VELMKFGIARVGVCALLALAASPPAAAAQETLNYASASGRVVDATGAAVAGAQVAARHTETNVTGTTTTAPDGRFRFPYLRVGVYDITVRLNGFAPATRRITLTVGAAFDLPITLSVASVETHVNVTAASPMLELSRSQIAGTISEAEVKTLPMNGRNFLDLALLIPGVSPTNVGGGTQLFPETSAVPGVGLSISSQRNLSNNFIVDGLSANDDAAGLSGIAFGVDAVDQFQVVTSGGQAELGRALGGYINIVTRGGTNALRGETYYYGRSSRFNAPNGLSQKRLPMSQDQYGFSLGGPVRRNRTFFFSNVEQRRLDQTGLVTIDAANVPIINGRLAAVGYLGPLVSTGEYPNPVDTANWMAKLDHQFGGNDHFSVRYGLYDVFSENSRGAGGLNAPSASAGIDNLDQTIAAGNVMALSSRTVLETRAQYGYSDLAAPPTDPIGPAVSIAGIASFGTLSGSPTGRVNKLYQIVNNLSHQAGAHAMRVGVDVLSNDLFITYPRSVRGAYTFSSMANFLGGVYGNAGFTQTFGETTVAETNPNLGVYVQDEWKARTDLTINAGVRYDLQVLETIETDTNNVAPRLGFVWAPFVSHRTIIRGNAGLFFDRVPMRALANALLSAGNTTDLANLRQIGVSLSPAQAGAPVFPNILPGVVPTVTLVNLTTMDRDIENAYSRQSSVEIEHQLGRSMTVSVGYQHLRGLKLIMQINQNVPSCAASGNNNGCRPISTYASNNQYSSAGTSVYDGLHVSFVQRPGRWGSYRVAYTYSKSMNNLGEAFFSSPIDPFDLSKDWGRSDDDQRHRLVIHGAVNTSMAAATTAWEHLSHGFVLSGVIQYYSALPFNITSGVTTIQGTAGRPIVDGAFIERNAGEGSAFSTVSLRLTRGFRFGRTQIEGLAEAFNLFNRRNDIARVTVFGTGTYPANPASNFGAVTVVGDPRSWQFGARVRF